MAEQQASLTTILGGYYIYKSIWDASVALLNATLHPSGNALPLLQSICCFKKIAGGCWA